MYTINGNYVIDDKQIANYVGRIAHDCEKHPWIAGLGIMKKASGGKVYTEKLSKDYNRQLKYTLKQAAEAAMRARDNPFRRKYLDMTLMRGIVPHRARLTIARDILATMLAMWRQGQ